MAKFLQETMGELSLDLKNAHAVNADEFNQFMLKVPTIDYFTMGHSNCITGKARRQGNKQRDFEIFQAF